jgi:hypothetical protein
MKKRDLVKIIKEEIQSILSEAAMPKRNVMYIYTTTEDGKTTKTKVKFLGAKRGSVPLQSWKGEMTFYQFRVYDKDGKPSKKATSIYVDPKKFTPANFKEVPVKVTEAAKEHVDKLNILDKGYGMIKGKVTNPYSGKLDYTGVNEGPEEMGAYRRLVITSPLMDKIKAEYTKFMARPEVKTMYPVRFKMIDSPKPDTFVVDVEGDKATVVAIKLSDLAKKLDKSVAIMVRKERKLK